MSTINVNTIQALTSAAPVFKNSSGTEKIRGVTAFAVFNGQGTAAFKTGDTTFNISSLTDNGTGDYTFSFTNAFSAGNYVAIGAGLYGSSHTFNGGSVRTRGTTSVRMVFGVSGGVNSVGFAADPADASITIIGKG